MGREVVVENGSGAKGKYHVIAAGGAPDPDADEILKKATAAFGASRLPLE